MNTCNAMEIWYNPSLPPVDSRNVLIKAKGYPDICTGFYSKGKWFSSCDFNDKDFGEISHLLMRRRFIVLEVQKKQECLVSR